MPIMNTDPSTRFAAKKAETEKYYPATTEELLNEIRWAQESDRLIVCIGNAAYFNFGPKEPKK